MGHTSTASTRALSPIIVVFVVADIALPATVPDVLGLYCDKDHCSQNTCISFDPPCSQNRAAADMYDDCLLARRDCRPRARAAASSAGCSGRPAGAGSLRAGSARVHEQRGRGATHECGVGSVSHARSGKREATPRARAEGTRCNSRRKLHGPSVTSRTGRGLFPGRARPSPAEHPGSRSSLRECAEAPRHRPARPASRRSRPPDWECRRREC
jgi:hypothetical protein